jgi:hypothetical protein
MEIVSCPLNFVDMDEMFYHVQSRALGEIDVFCELQRLEDDREISMAGVEIKGFEQLCRDVEAFEKMVVDEAVKAAEDAAAQVVKTAVEAAAPRKTGQLASSVQVFESQDRRALTGQSRFNCRPELTVIEI